MARAYLLRAGEGLDGDASLKAGRASTMGSLTLIESDTDGGAPPHVHEHEWDVVGDRAVVLIIASPAGLEEFLADFHAAPDWAARDAVAARHGLTFPR